MSQVSSSEPSQNEPVSDGPKAVGDDFAWLYRRDSYAPGVTAGDPQTLLLPLPPSALPSDGPAAAPPRGRNPMIIMSVILLCLTAGAVAGIAVLLHPASRTAATGSAESSVQNAAPSAASPSAQVASAMPNQVKVGCQAPQSADDAGNPVYYVPEQMLDGEMSTAWRCNGNGIGQVVTFEFPTGTTIVEVGRVPPDYQSDVDLCERHVFPAVAGRRGEDRAETEHSLPTGRAGDAHDRGEHRSGVECQGPRCRRDL